MTFQTRVLTVLVLLIGSLAFAEPNSIAGMSDYDSVAGTRMIESLPEGFFTPATMPTQPVLIGSLPSEWEPSSLVLISVPLKATLSNSKILAFVSEFLAAVVPHVRVAILFNRDEEKLLGRFIREIEVHPVLGELIDRIDFVQSRAQSYWIRDHGPQFGRSKDGSLVVFDTIYRYLEADSVYDPSRVDEFSQSVQGNYSNDLTPQFVVNYLRSDHQYEAIVVRPPLQLHGGDFATDGKGNVFVSEDTVSSNGRELGFVGSVFSNYYDADYLHILSGPSGNSAKHLDLLFKVGSENVFLIGRPPAPSAQSTSYNRKLLEQMTRVANNNRNYIERNLPDAKMIDLPMPSLLESSRESRLGELRREILNVVSRKTNSDLNLVLTGDPRSPDVENARNAVALEMLVDTGLNINLLDDAHLEATAKIYLGISVEEYLETYVNQQAIYRSYTNSLIIKNSDLETLILLPRFLPQQGESQKIYTAYEKEVESVYLGLYPEAELKWIESDDITSFGGSLHCMSVGVPIQKKLVQSRNLKTSLN
jgi:agmatine/peptidylarginine deiminase